jgi:Tol biopolymer transport system component
MNASKGAAMKWLMLVLSAICLALVAILATQAILSDPGGAESAGPVPSALSPRPSPGEKATTPGENTTPGTETSAKVHGVPKVDYVLDLYSGVKTPLPNAIIRSLGDPDETSLFPSWADRYAASSDGSRLAYVAVGDEGSLQVFIADIDGTGVRQVTHDPRGAIYPALSPDGTMIAYKGSTGYRRDELSGGGALFVLDIVTGESTPIADAGPLTPWSHPQFTPDGSSLLYETHGFGGVVLRTVPIDGGKSTVMIGPDEGMGYAGSGSLSPDGSLVTMTGNEVAGPGAAQFVANADGSEKRIIGPGCPSNPAGAWAPDGTRIVCTASDTRSRSPVVVIDIATERRSPVAEGNGAIWLDRHTLLVEVS